MLQTTEFQRQWSWRREGGRNGRVRGRREGEGGRRRRRKGRNNDEDDDGGK